MELIILILLLLLPLKALTRPPIQQIHSNIPVQHYAHQSLTGKANSKHHDAMEYAGKNVSAGNNPTEVNGSWIIAQFLHKLNVSVHI